MRSLQDMQKQVVEFCESKGWHDTDRSFGEHVALLHSELSEALEEYRLGRMTTQFKHGQVIDDIPTRGGILSKPVGMPSELADVFIRLLDTCSTFGVDLETEFIIKMAYNKTREYRHGGKAL